MLPTQQDSWALPVSEALAAGCVVVTSQYAGSCDLIDHGVNGYVMHGRGDPEALAALLNGPLTNADTRKTVATRGREAVVAYDYESVYTVYRAAHHRAHELALKRRIRT